MSNPPFPGTVREFGYVETATVPISTTASDIVLIPSPGLGKQIIVWGLTPAVWNGTDIAGNLFHTSSSAANFVLPVYAHSGTTAVDNNNAIIKLKIPIALPENTPLVMRATVISASSRLTLEYTVRDNG